MVAWLSSSDGFTLQNRYRVMMQDIRLAEALEDFAAHRETVCVCGGGK